MAAGTTHDSAAGWPDDAIEVGRVLDGWGIKGWIKVQPFAIDGGALVAADRWFLKSPDAGAARRPVVAGNAVKPWPTSLEILQSRIHGDWVVALVAGVSDRTAAEALRGARVFVSRAFFPKAGDDEYYWIDLIGMSVVNLQDEHLGTVSGLMDNGPQSVLRIAPHVVDDSGLAGQSDGEPSLDSATDIRPPEEVERLIPFVGAYVIDVDMAARRIKVDWGLDY